MKLATFNVNGVNGRLPVLLRWLDEAAPDIVCLQELKASQDKFPEGPIRDAGYRAIWHGQKSWNGVAILARGINPVETRRGLPGDPDDTHSRYIEAAVNGLLVGCLYLPNGNPAPGPKFDFKLRWFDRLAAHAKALLASGAPVVLAGDYNVMPTDLDVYKPEPVTLDDFTAAIERIVAGLEKKSRVLGPAERNRVAHHEMGHALVAATLPGVDPVHKVSIIPRGVGALGYTMQRPTEDRFLLGRQELENRIAVLMGGRAAEALVYRRRGVDRRFRRPAARDPDRNGNGHALRHERDGRTAHLRADAAPAVAGRGRRRTRRRLGRDGARDRRRGARPRGEGIWSGDRHPALTPRRSR